MLIQNLLPEFLQKNIYDELMGSYFPWFYNDNANVYEDKNENTFQFIHIFFQNSVIQSQYYNLIVPIIGFFEKETNIKIKSIYRIKANLNTRYNLDEKDKLMAIHKDVPEDNYISLIYYVNDSDGDTVIYDENNNITERITPRCNNLYYFKSNTKHMATFPLINKRRIIINFVIEI